MDRMTDRSIGPPVLRSAGPPCSPNLPMRPRLLAAALALAAPLCVARAQTAAPFTTNDPVLQRIWAIGMDSSHTMELASTLFDSLGPRLQGAPDTRRAQDWLVTTYQTWGINATNEQ